MHDAWNSYEERASLGDVMLALFDAGVTSPHSLEGLVVDNSIIAAFERRIGDGYDGVLVEGCRRSIESFRHIIDRRVIAKGNVGSITDDEVSALAFELANDMRKRRIIRDYAESQLFDLRAAIFSNIEITHGYAELTIYKRKFDNTSEDDIARIPHSSHFEPVLQTLNRALAIIEFTKYSGIGDRFIDLYIRVLACKRLGSELLGWRY